MSIDLERLENDMKPKQHIEVFVIAEGKHTAWRLARMTASGQLPVIHKSGVECLEAFSAYPAGKRHMYAPFKVVLEHNEWGHRHVQTYKLT